MQHGAFRVLNVFLPSRNISYLGALNFPVRYKNHCPFDLHFMYSMFVWTFAQRKLQKPWQAIMLYFHLYAVKLISSNLTQVYVLPIKTWLKLIVLGSPWPFWLSDVAGKLYYIKLWWFVVQIQMKVFVLLTSAHIYNQYVYENRNGLSYLCKSIH